MKYGLSDRGLNKKAICYLVVIGFLTVSINQCDASLEAIGDPSSSCHGFILPNVRFDDRTLENQVFCKIRHLVNDLLRDEIPVYWTTSNITVNISEANSGIGEYELFFEKGSFVIPFTGDDVVDSKIVVIVCDYNQSSEIENNNNGMTPIYLLKEQLDFKGNELKDVKIVNFLDFLMCGGSWYIDVAYKCGFLNYDFVNNDNASKRLDNLAYNLLIWPGYDRYYPSAFLISEIFLDLRCKRNRAVRDFVSNDGGFVGSCQAAYVAARGVKPIPPYPSIVTQNPNLPSVGVLFSLSDYIAAEGKKITVGLEQEIVDVDHPIVYGVDSYLTGGFLLHGPKIMNVGKSVNVIANYKNDSYLNGTPSIITNRFGGGKIVAFSPHAEIRDPDLGPKFWDAGNTGTCNGKKLITNAFYYTTCEDESEHELSESRPLSFIYDVWDGTCDLSSQLNEQNEVFTEIKTNINNLIVDSKNINDKIYLILDTITQIGIDYDLDSKEVIKRLYYDGHIYLTYCFDLIIEYLENTSSKLQTIEKIYNLYELDADFIEELQILKSGLLSATNKLKEILSTSLEKLEKIESILESYNPNKIFHKIKEKLVKKTSHDIEIQTEYAFQLMPGGYFHTLKFLRDYWYDFETSLIIN